jgi:hypothetical protein
MSETVVIIMAEVVTFFLLAGGLVFTVYEMRRLANEGAQRRIQRPRVSDEIKFRARAEEPYGGWVSERSPSLRSRVVSR